MSATMTIKLPPAKRNPLDTDPTTTDLYRQLKNIDEKPAINANTTPDKIAAITKQLAHLTCAIDQRNKAGIRRRNNDEYTTWKYIAAALDQMATTAANIADDYPD